MQPQHTSKHRVGDEVVEIPRKFAQIHVDAGYHEQEWGEHSHSDHELLGDHEGVRVEHQDEHEVIGGPVFKLTFSDGASVDVLCADVVRAYLGDA